jgi:replicative DNA helicase
VISQCASELVLMSTTLERKNVKSDMREDIALRLYAYEDRVKDQYSLKGMRFGIPAIDAHVRGIHPGELAIVAGGPKTGKSWALAWSALQDWRAGRSVILYTLENSVEMTEDRIACLGARVDYAAFQHGQLSPDEIDRLMAFVAELRASPHPLWVFQPDLGKRSFEHMVAQAMIYEADSVYIDQLTFVELEDTQKSKTERIGDALHRLKGMISTGRRPIPVMLAHQINRDGVKSADKIGYLEMWHLADSAEVERTADWVFGMYASRDDKTAMRCKWQTMGTRRSWNLNWELFWDPYHGHIDVNKTLELA